MLPAIRRYWAKYRMSLRRAGVQLQGAQRVFTRGAPIPIVHQLDAGNGNMRLLAIAVQRHCLGRILLRQSPGLFGTFVICNRAETIEISQTGVRGSIGGIQRDGAFEIPLSGFSSIEAIQLEAASQVRFDNLRPGGRAFGAAEDLKQQLAADSLRNLGLQRQNIADAAVERIRP